MMINNKANKAISKLVQDLLYNSLAQTLVRIFQTKHLVIKIYLAFVTILLASFAAYLTVESILSYMNYEVITTSRTVSETPATFPKITLCNINMFTSKYASELIKQINELVAPKESLFDYDQIKNISSQNYELLWQTIDFSAVAHIFNANFDEGMKKQIAHHFEDILIACQFNNQPCSASDFAWSFDPYYGNCYSFNTGFNASGEPIALKESSVSGWVFGLKVELYVNFNQNLSIFNDASGLMVRIGNSSYVTDQNLDGIRIASGFRTDVAINREFNQMMPQPYSNCLADSNLINYDSELFNLILNSPYQYSQKMCLGQCYQRETLRRCNCTVSIIVSLYSNTHQCGHLNPSEVKCALITFNEIYLVNNFITQKCLPLCPLECNSSIFMTTLSSNVIHGYKYISHLMQNPTILNDFNSKNIDSNTAGRSVCNLNIFYDSLSYKLSYDSPKMGVVSLLASIGGNLSLFLGVSVFSLSELVEFFIEVYFMKRIKVEKNVPVKKINCKVNAIEN
jgi:hypothetical protein